MIDWWANFGRDSLVAGVIAGLLVALISLWHRWTAVKRGKPSPSRHGLLFVFDFVQTVSFFTLALTLSAMAAGERGDRGADGGEGSEGVAVVAAVGRDVTRVIAALTAQACERLGLVPGRPVHLVMKTHSCRVYPALPHNVAPRQGGEP